MSHDSTIWLKTQTSTIPRQQQLTTSHKSSVSSSSSSSSSSKEFLASNTADAPFMIESHRHVRTSIPEENQSPVKIRPTTTQYTTRHSPGRYFEARSAELSELATATASSSNEKRVTSPPPQLILSCEIGNAVTFHIPIRNMFDTPCQLSATTVAASSNRASPLVILPPTLKLDPNSTGSFQLIFCPIPSSQQQSPPSSNCEHHLVTITCKSSTTTKFHTKFAVKTIIAMPPLFATPPQLPYSASMLMCTHRMIDFGDDVHPMMGASQAFTLKNMSRHIIAFTAKFRKEEPDKMKYFKLARHGSEHVLDPNDECRLMIELVPDPQMTSKSVAYNCVVIFFARVFTEVGGGPLASLGDEVKLFSLMVRGRTRHV